MSFPELPTRLPARPSLFLQAPEGNAWLKDFVREYPYTAFHRCERDIISLSEGNKIASSILEARYKSLSGEQALYGKIGCGDPYVEWYQWVCPELSGTLDHYDLPPSKKQEWLDHIQDLWIERAAAEDDSTPADIAPMPFRRRCRLMACGHR